VVTEYEFSSLIDTVTSPVIFIGFGGDVSAVTVFGRNGINNKITQSIVIVFFILS
jgi:hypothetical protein